MAKPSSDTQPLNAAQDDDASETVTLEKVSQLINQAITARNRSFEAKLSEQLADLKSVIQPKAEQPEAKPSKLADDPMVLALQNQVKALSEKNARSREIALREAAKAQFVKAGVAPAMAAALVAQHVTAEKSIQYASDDSDEIIFKTSDSVFTLNDGISDWSKTDDAKAFMAPRGTVGSGDRNYKSSALTSQGEKPTMASFTDALLNMKTE